MLQIASPFQQIFDTDGSPLDNGYIYIGTANANPEVSPISLWWDDAGTIPAAQPIRTQNGYIVRNGSPARVYTSQEDYSLTVKNRNGLIVLTVLDATSFADADKISFVQDGIGAVTRTVQSKLRETVSVKDFGAIGDGIADDTLAIKAWLDYLITNTAEVGYWNDGIYSVDEGVLIIQPPSNIHWPGVQIETAGYKRTILKGRGTTQAPLLTIRNLPQSSPAGKFLKGGKLGPIGFDGSAQSAGWTASHGLSLQGVDGWEFGFINGEQVKGDVVHIPQNLYAVTNPDPYHVAFCVFLGIQANFCNGWALNNDNFVGFTSNEVFNVVMYNGLSGKGAIRSGGAGNIYKKISVGTCLGWAIEVYDGAGGGRASRETYQIAELDDPEYGIKVFNADQCIFDQVRIVHRYHAGIGYWPRESLRLADASHPSFSNTFLDIAHRIEAGGVKADLGGFIRCQGSNSIEGVEIVYKITDNAGFGITNSDVLSGANIDSLTSIRILTNVQGNRTVAFDNQSKPVAYVTINGSATIPNGGFAGIGNKIATTGEVYDRRNNFNTATSSYTVPVTGIYVFSCAFSVSGVTAGVRFRFGLFNETANQIIKYFSQETTSNLKLVFTGTGMVSLTAGEVVSFNADNNGGSAIPINTVFSNAAENNWSIQLLESAR